MSTSHPYLSPPQPLFLLTPKHPSHLLPLVLGDTETKLAGRPLAPPDKHRVLSSSSSSFAIGFHTSVISLLRRADGRMDRQTDICPPPTADLQASIFLWIKNFYGAIFLLLVHLHPGAREDTHTHTHAISKCRWSKCETDKLSQGFLLLGS